MSRRTIANCVLIQNAQCLGYTKPKVETVENKLMCHGFPEEVFDDKTSMFSCHNCHYNIRNPRNKQMIEDVAFIAAVLDHVGGGLDRDIARGAITEEQAHEKFDQIRIQLHDMRRRASGVVYVETKEVSECTD